MTALNKYAELRGQSVDGSFYLVECCNCGEMYPSNLLDGGEPLFSGDYGDCYCHLCGADDTERADWGDVNSNEAKAWNFQQKRIEALLDELDAAEKRIAEHNFENRLLANADSDIKALRQRIAELEARTITVKFEPIPMEELGNRRDGKKHPYMFGAGYNSAVVHCESVLHQACAAAGIGVKGE